MSDPVQDIKRLREARGFRGRDVTIGAVVRSMAEDADRTQQKMGAFITLWNELLPHELAGRTAVMGIRGGVVSVSADSASVAFEIDRRLREGLLQTIRSRHRSTIVRIKIKVGGAGPA